MEYVVETVEGLEYSFADREVADFSVDDTGVLKVHGINGRQLAGFRHGGWRRWFLRESDGGES